MMILLIALIPAVIVFFVAVGTESKAKTTVAALIAAAIGVFTGNPAYMVLDIVTVIAAYWLAMTVVWDTTKPEPQVVVVAVPKPMPAINKSESESFSTVVVIAIFGVIAYSFWASGSKQNFPNQLPPPASSQPIVAAQSPYVASQSAPEPAPAVAKKQSKRPAKSPLQRCLEIKSEDKMADCLAGLD